MTNPARFTYIFIAEAKNEWNEPYEFKWSGEGNKSWLSEEDIAIAVERYAMGRPSGTQIRHCRVLKRIDNWTGRIHEAGQ